MVPYWLRRASALWRGQTHLRLWTTHRSGQTTGTNMVCVEYSPKMLCQDVPGKAFYK